MRKCGLALLILGCLLGGCVVVGPGHGGYYYHHHDWR